MSHSRGVLPGNEQLLEGYAALVLSSAGGTLEAEMCCQVIERTLFKEPLFSTVDRLTAPVLRRE